MKYKVTFHIEDIEQEIEEELKRQLPNQDDG